MLKKGSGNANAKDEARKAERKHEFRKHRKKEWREKSNAPESGKDLDKWLEEEIKIIKKMRQNTMSAKGKITEIEGS